VSPQIKFSKINHGIDHEIFIVTFITDTTIYPARKMNQEQSPHPWVGPKGPIQNDDLKTRN